MVLTVEFPKVKIRTNTEHMCTCRLAEYTSYTSRIDDASREAFYGSAVISHIVVPWYVPTPLRFGSLGETLHCGVLVVIILILWKKQAISMSDPMLVLLQLTTNYASSFAIDANIICELSAPFGEPSYVLRTWPRLSIDASIFFEFILEFFLNLF